MHGDALTDKDAVKSRLGIEADTWDDLFDLLILSVTSRMEQTAGRRFVQSDTEFEDELHDGSDAWGSHRTTLILVNAPVSEIASVEYRAGSNSTPNWTAFSQDAYHPDLASGLLHFPGGLPRGFQNIRVTYTGGFEEYPAELVDLCERIVIRLFKKRESEGKSAETFQESSVTWDKSLFSEEDFATIRNYRRGYNV